MSKNRTGQNKQKTHFQGNPQEHTRKEAKRGAAHNAVELVQKDALSHFQLLYESRDGQLCLFEDADGHLCAVCSKSLA